MLIIFKKKRKTLKGGWRKLAEIKPVNGFDPWNLLRIMPAKGTSLK